MEKNEQRLTDLWDYSKDWGPYYQSPGRREKKVEIQSIWRNNAENFPNLAKDYIIYRFKKLNSLKQDELKEIYS